MKKLNVSIVMLLSVITVSAQTTKNIFESLGTSDSLTHAVVRVHQDKRIEQLISDRKNLNNAVIAVTSNGYRVQVFSSNTQRTAKSEAFKIEKMIKEEFPDQEVYVNYLSPFWKVRVGDFRTLAEAQAFRAELVGAFPQLRNETYPVKDQILLKSPK